MKTYSIDKPVAGKDAPEIIAECRFIKYKTFLEATFYINEKSIVAKNLEINSPVFEDSAVEIFISFDNGANYYNLEFNCIGTPLMQYGANRANREFLNPNFEIRTTLEKKPIKFQEGEFYWELYANIPYDIFKFDKIDYHFDKDVKFNIYKCGGNPQNRHYLSLFPIETKTPDFHRPEFFGSENFKEW